MSYVGDKAKEFLRRNQALGHFFITLALLYVGFLILHAFDPRIGVEGFGDLFGYGLHLAGLTLVMFTSWWIKNNIWRDLSSKEEDELFKLASTGNKSAHWTIIRDRLEWIFLMVWVGTVVF